MTLTTAVRSPTGQVANRIQSGIPEAWARNCLLTCSPNRETKGARLVKEAPEKASLEEVLFELLLSISGAMAKAVNMTETFLLRRRKISENFKKEDQASMKGWGLDLCG